MRNGVQNLSCSGPTAVLRKVEVKESSSHESSIPAGASQSEDST